MFFFLMCLSGFFQKPMGKILEVIGSHHWAYVRKCEGPNKAPKEISYFWCSWGVILRRVLKKGYG